MKKLITPILITAGMLFLAISSIPGELKILERSNNSGETKGLITEIKSFEDFVDNEFGQGGSYVEYQYSLQFRTEDDKMITTKSTSKKFPSKDEKIESLILPQQTTVIYSRTEPTFAYSPEFTESPNKVWSIIYIALILFGTLGALFYLTTTVVRTFKNS